MEHALLDWSSHSGLRIRMYRSQYGLFVVDIFWIFIELILLNIALGPGGCDLADTRVCDRAEDISDLDQESWYKYLICVNPVQTQWFWAVKWHEHWESGTIEGCLPEKSPLAIAIDIPLNTLARWSRCDAFLLIKVGRIPRPILRIVESLFRIVLEC